jgi:predicted secreted protein
MAESGNSNKIYIVTNTSTYTVVGGELSNSLTVNSEIINISNKDSDWAANIAGEKSFEASGSFHMDKASAGKAALVAGASVTIFIGEISGQTPVYGVKGAAIISSVAIASERNAAVTLDISFTGTGALAYINGVLPTTTVAATTTTGS